MSLMLCRLSYILCTLPADGRGHLWPLISYRFLPRSSSSFVKIAPLFEVLLSIYKASQAQSPSPSPEYINVMAVLALHRNEIHQYLAKA